MVRKTPTLYAALLVLILAACAPVPATQPVASQNGIVIYEAALELAKQPEVRSLAQSIVNAQTSEIALMQELLQQKGFPPVPEDAGMNMSDDGTMTP